MIKIGITGGIGSGKSIVSELFRLYGIPVYIADVESKRLTETSPIIKKGLSDLAGNDIYTEQGLNKKKLATLIFNDKQMLNQVNKIIHPEVSCHFEHWVKQQTSSVCAIESAILFESGFNTFVDKTLLIFAPEALRIKRACKRDQTSAELVRQRIRNQLSDNIKKEWCDYVLYNDDKTALIPQIYALLKSFS
ncbi:MAG: dephospho-CoA kinase [Massilibacteroides sp.]|nr:dephospho-CoA kinase [Massilibacteroides sp.]MDD3062723.1 dephospho-CoA kinase [Massilibacteroides sp.]MDD4114153.1 dephospho-CoA kinase [Massilibacteroides sp.]MDD4660486.1 dephospho-CoA kinase [Massilibacteroides sp.]